MASILPKRRFPLFVPGCSSWTTSMWVPISSLQFKSPTVALVLSIFLGCYGIDRFYIGHIGLGVAKLLTCGGIGIWAIIDWFLILGATRNENLKKLEPLLL